MTLGASVPTRVPIPTAIETESKGSLTRQFTIPCSLKKTQRVCEAHRVRFTSIRQFPTYPVFRLPPMVGLCLASNVLH